MRKVLLLNGIKECGKGVLTQYLSTRHLLDIISCKDKLYELVQIYFHLSQEEFLEIYNDRSLKEAPLPHFKIPWGMATKLWSICGNMPLQHDGDGGCNLSLRQAMIYISEVVTKPHFGKDFFGRARGMSVLRSTCELIVDDSAGFIEEIPPLMEAVGQGNVMLLRIHRNGDDFGGDSRGFIPDGIVDNTVDVYNKAIDEVPDITFKDMDNVWGDFLLEATNIIEERLLK